MKNQLLVILSTLSFSISAAETITIVSGASPTHSGTASLQQSVREANALQEKYNFVIEFKPGGQGVIALSTMDASPHNKIAGIAPAFINNIEFGLIKEENYLPVSAQGDACWAVITNIGNTDQGIDSLAEMKGKEVFVGGTGIGNAAHLTSLILAEKYGFKVNYVVFKSNYDGLVNMVGNNGINLVLERVASYKQFKLKQPNLQILGINCTSRIQDMPEIKTLKEQGLDTPMIFNLFVANKDMPADKRKEIGAILDAGQKVVGKQKMLELSDLMAPQFDNVSIGDFFRDRVNLIKQLTLRFKDKVQRN